MFYLFFAIICSASIALIFKYTESKNLNRFAVTTVNYVTAFSISLILLLNKEATLDSGLFKALFKENGQSGIVLQHMFSQNPSMIWTIMLGIAGGFFFFYSFVFYQKSVRANGAGISGAFGKMGILLPLMLSLILWSEMPSMLQWIGIALSLISILIVNFDMGTKRGIVINKLLFSLFILNGMAEFMNKLFQKYVPLQYKEVFLFWVFFMAFIFSAFYTLREGRKITILDIKAGFMVGIPNFLSSFFLILALDNILASVAFPVFSAGTILFISLGSFLLFKETFKRKEIVAIVLIIASLMLINI